MKKTAFMFPGQGSQYVGMGLEFHQEYGEAREIFDMVEDLCKRHIRRLCFKGPMEDLTETVNLQPAVTAVNLACWKVLAREGLTPGFAAGHSLGEYSALAAAGAIRPEDAVRLVLRRGELMHRDALRRKGAMAAVIGLGIEDVVSLLEKAREAGPVSLANHNTPTQMVVTGSVDGVNRACELARERKARAVPLKVSGAWHSEFMEGAREDFAGFLDQFEFLEADIPVALNTTGTLCSAAVEIQQIMAKQLTRPVKWVDAVNSLRDEDVARFVEVGPGKVLSGLVKKTLPRDYPFAVHNVEDMKSLERCLAELL